MCVAMQRLWWLTSAVIFAGKFGREWICESGDIAMQLSVDLRFQNREFCSSEFWWGNIKSYYSLRLLSLIELFFFVSKKLNSFFMVKEVVPFFYNLITVIYLHNNNIITVIYIIKKIKILLFTIEIIINNYKKILI
jgi:hypothetical protein